MNLPVHFVNIIGLIAGALTTSSFFPQIFKILRTKQTRDLSLSMYIGLSVGIFLWLVYGLLAGALPVIVSNALALGACIYIVAMKIKYG